MSRAGCKKVLCNRQEVRRHVGPDGMSRQQLFAKIASRAEEGGFEKEYVIVVPPAMMGIDPPISLARGQGRGQRGR